MKFAKIAMFRRVRRVPCKLNNVTKRKHQTETILRNRNQEVAKYAVESITRNGNYKNEAMEIALWKIWAAERLFRYHFIESLILAQDERWRRA